MNELLSKYNLLVSDQVFEENQKKHVILGMSGGVDSSVCAVILKAQGYKVTGFFMKNWEDDEHCNSKQDYADVRSVCENIGIEYHSINFVEEYKRGVFDRFIQDYKAGKTPNPDILCNQEIKFKTFFNMAKSLGADFIATGHYCRTDSKRLLKGRDRNKDQSYFLYTIQSHVLDQVLFPLGNLEKSAVRQIAIAAQLSVATKKDSTGICFIGERNFREFLGNYIEESKGDFIDYDSGEIKGHHEGHCFHTLGQRKGLGIGGPGGPWFVVGKNTVSNKVFVSDDTSHKALTCTKVWLKDVAWVGEAASINQQYTAKVRYRQDDQLCWVRFDNNQWLVEFEKPQRAVALEQSVVIYAEETCLGGGVVELTNTSFDPNRF